MKKVISLLVCLMLIAVALPLQVSADPGTDLEWRVENYDIVIPDGYGINTVRIAPGILTTSNEIRQAAGLITLNRALCAANTDNGVFRYTMRNAGVYSLWVRYDSGETYIISGADLTNFTPEIGAINGLTVTVDGIRIDDQKGVADLIFARGELADISECSDAANLIADVTAAQISGKLVNYGRSFKYTIAMDDISADGKYTVGVRFNDSEREPEILHFNIEYPNPQITVNGLQSRVTGLNGIKRLYVAPGEYDKLSDIRTASGVRIFSYTTSLKDKTEYTVQYSADGQYTLGLEYSGGYTKIETITIEHHEPTYTINADNTVTFSGLDDLYIIRYAPNPNKTELARGEFKSVAGNKYVKPAGLDASGNFTTPVLTDLEYKAGGEVLTSSVWSFMIQYNDNSTTIFTIDFDDLPGDDAVVSRKSFTGSGVNFSNYSGTIGGTEFEGVLATSGAYQPTFYFNEYGVNRIKAYAEANGYDALRIHVYSILNDNYLVVNGTYIDREVWATVDVNVNALDTTYNFFSGGGSTTVYMWFEFITLPTVNAGSFTGSGVNFSDYSGTIGGTAFEGVLATSGAYQPTFYFNEYGVNRIKAYAEANGYVALKIHAYSILNENYLVINGTYIDREVWSTVDVAISALDTTYNFFSGGGSTTVYMWFEFVEAPTIHAGSFTGSGVNFSDYSGTIGGTAFEGVQATSGAYQPTFYFNEYGVNRIKAYAEANGYDILRIHVYSILNENYLVINGTYIDREVWSTVDVAISALDTTYNFFSGGGSTTVYMWFEFVEAPVVNASSFSGGGFTFTDVTNETIGGEAITGVKGISYAYQPTFNFTAGAVADITDYMNANGYTNLIIHAYAILDDNCFVLNNRAWVVDSWNSDTLAISEITTSYSFWSQGSNHNEIYMWFEFVTAPVVSASSFSGGGFTFEDFTGEVGGETITGVKGISYAYQPTFNFTAGAVADITDYMNANGYTNLIIHAYAILDENCFVLNNRAWVVNSWNSDTLAISEITTSYNFWSQGSNQNEIYMWFEFC